MAEREARRDIVPSGRHDTAREEISAVDGYPGTRARRRSSLWRYVPRLPERAVVITWLKRLLAGVAWYAACALVLWLGIFQTILLLFVAGGVIWFQVVLAREATRWVVKQALPTLTRFAQGDEEKTHGS